MSLPSNLNDETDSHSCILVCTAESINYEKSLVGELFLSDILNNSPCSFCHRVVVVLVLVCCPPNCVLGVLIHNDVLIFRGTTCKDTCHNVNGIKLSNLTNLITCKTVFCLFLKEKLVRRVVDDLGCAGDAILC